MEQAAHIMIPRSAFHMEFLKVCDLFMRSTGAIEGGVI